MQLIEHNTEHLNPARVLTTQQNQSCNEDFFEDFGGWLFKGSIKKGKGCWYMINDFEATFGVSNRPFYMA